MTLEKANENWAIIISWMQPCASSLMILFSEIERFQGTY